MTLHTEKDLQSKKFQGKKKVYKTRISIRKEILKSKPNRLEKDLFFGSP